MHSLVTSQTIKVTLGDALTFHLEGTPYKFPHPLGQVEVEDFTEKVPVEIRLQESKSLASLWTQFDRTISSDSCSSIS